MDSLNIVSVNVLQITKYVKYTTKNTYGVLCVKFMYVIDRYGFGTIIKTHSNELQSQEEAACTCAYKST